MRKGGRGNGHTSGRYIPVFKKRREGVRGRALAHKPQQNFDGLVTQALEKVRFGVTLASRGEERLEHALYLVVAHGPKHIGCGGGQGAQGPHQLFALRNGAAVARRHAKDRWTSR